MSETPPRGSRRKTPLPPGWRNEIRPRVLARDGWTCQIRGPRCITDATEVDHAGDRDDHDDDNLRAACQPCHATRTGQQAAAARTPRPSRRRPAEKHPGLI